MLHPSYAELIKAVNSETESDAPVINSRYSIVLAAAKRARQLIDGKKPLSAPPIDKPLSIAVDELSKGLVKILTEDAQEELEISEIGEPEAEAPAEEEAQPEEKDADITEEIVEEVTEDLAQDQLGEDA